MRPKKLFYICVSVLLIVCMTCVQSAALTAPKVNPNAQSCPYIFVHGFMAVPLYKNLHTPQQEKIWPPSKEKILEATKQCAPAVGRYLVNGDWDQLSDSVLPKFREVFQDVFLDSYGTPYMGTGVDFDWPDASTITASSRLTFQYDWRLDPILIAAQLDAFIDYVCAASGCKQVAVMAHSCGGVIVTTYAKLYGTEKLRGVVLNSTAVLGETYTGEMMCGSFYVGEDALKAYFTFLGYGSEYEDLIFSVTNTLMRQGVIGKISGMFDAIFEHMLDRISAELIMPMFGSWVTIWAMTPDEYLDGAYDFILGKVAAATGEDYSGLAEKVDRYNTLIRPYRIEAVQAMADNGHFGVFSRYGFVSIPLSPTWDKLSDGVIDVANTSFGATAAPYNQQLDADYLAAVDAQYISPDRTVDASSCMFPDRTWFIRNMKHGKPILNLDDLVFAILYADETVTVYTYEDYPRFLMMDYVLNRISKDTPVKQSLMDKLFPWAKNFFGTISDLARFLLHIVFKR